MSEPIGKAVSFDRKRLQHDIAVARDNISGTQGHAGHVGHIVFFWVNFVSGSQGHTGQVDHVMTAQYIPLFLPPSLPADKTLGLSCDP